MKTHTEMVESLFERRDVYIKKSNQRKQMFIRYGVPAVCVAVVASLGLTVFKFNQNSKLFNSPTSLLSGVASPPLSSHSSSSCNQSGAQSGVDSHVSSSLSVPSNMTSSEQIQSEADIIEHHISTSSPTGNSSTASKPVKLPCQLLQMEYENFDSFITDLRDLSGLQGDKSSLDVLTPEPEQEKPDYKVPENDTPASPPESERPPEEPISPPSSGGNLADESPSYDHPMTDAPDLDDCPSSSEPFDNATTKEELEQKEIYNTLFKNGYFYIPSMKKGNSTYILINIDVSTQGICYYYRNQVGENDPENDYDLMIRVPLYFSNVKQEYNSTPTTQRYASVTDDGIDYIFVSSDETDTRFKIYFCVDKYSEQWCSAEYYGSSDYNQLKRVVKYLKLEIYNWQ